MAWYWHPVVPRLRAAGHEAIAVDLPGDDREAGLSAYVNVVVAAATARDDVVVVAQSMGAFTAVPVCTRLAARRLVLLNAMLPAPGETVNDWWETTGWQAARRAAARVGGYPDDVDLQTYFLHDVPPEVRPAISDVRLLDGERPFGRGRLGKGSQGPGAVGS